MRKILLSIFVGLLVVDPLGRHLNHPRHSVCQRLLTGDAQGSGWFPAPLPPASRDRRNYAPALIRSNISMCFCLSSGGT